MSDIRIEVFSGGYDNEDAYNKVLGYISNKTYFGGYGFTFNSPLPVIEQFRLSETCSSHSKDSGGQKIWHFIITFTNSPKHSELLILADQTSLDFSAKYQIMYGLDTEKGNSHLHFGVNAFSFYPDCPSIPALFQ